jgi:hypothetical protein
VAVDPVLHRAAAEAALEECGLDTALRKRAENLLLRTSWRRMVLRTSDVAIKDFTTKRGRTRGGAFGGLAKNPKPPLKQEALLRDELQARLRQSLFEQDWSHMLPEDPSPVPEEYKSIPIQKDRSKSYALELQMVMGLLLREGVKPQLKAAKATAALLHLAGIAGDLFDFDTTGKERVLHMWQAKHRRMLKGR